MYKPRFKGTHYDVGFNYGKMLRLKGVKLDSILSFNDESVNMVVNLALILCGQLVIN